MSRTTLESTLGNLLTAKKYTLAIAESCTGGLLAARIVNNPGCSQYFAMGVITYTPEAKNNLLKVSKQLLARYGAVSRETALAMASGIKKWAKSTCAISVTGLAGPSNNSLEPHPKPVGLIYIGIITPKKESVYELKLRGSRQEIRQKIVAKALTLFNQELRATT